MLRPPGWHPRVRTWRGGAAAAPGNTSPLTRQLTLKVAIVVDALRRIAHLPEALVSPGAAVPMTGYRTSARLAVGPDGAPAYHRWRGRELVRVDSCLVAHPLLEELIVEGRFPGAGEVVLRVGARTGERLASPDRLGSRHRATVPAGTHVGRRAFIHEEIAGRRWRFSAASFAQSGPEAADALVTAVRAAAAGTSGAVVDLYAGVGVLGWAVAGDARRLVAVEGGAAAAADAAANLAALGGAVVVAADVAEALAVAPVTALRPGVVIADPTRSGLGPSVVDAIAALGAPVVVLVSCDPASLGRDAGGLTAAGYRVERVEVLDLFPGTFHVETVSRLVLTSGTPGGAR